MNNDITNDLDLGIEDLENVEAPGFWDGFGDGWKIGFTAGVTIGVAILVTT